MTKIEVAEIVTVLAAAYPHAAMGEKTSEVYEAMLADLTRDAVKRACARLIATSRFLPTVAEIRSTVTEFEHGAKRFGGEAWGDVIGEIRRVGSYGEPKFSDPLTAEAVRLMGWRYLCLSENDAPDRARFIDVYEGIQERIRRDAAAGKTLALPTPKSNPVRGLLGKIGRELPGSKVERRAPSELMAALVELDGEA